MSDKVEEVKNTFEEILNVKTDIVTKNVSNNSDKNKFISVINDIEMIYTRSNILVKEFGMDMSSYENPMYRIIDNIIELTYGKKAKEIIHFYLFNRMSPDGIPNMLVDSKGNKFTVENVETLWLLVNNVKKKK